MNIPILLALLMGVQTASAQDSAYETAFRDSYRVNSIQQCVATASKSGTAAARINFEPVCTCIADTMLATKTMAELNEPLNAEEAKPVALACIAKHPLQPLAQP